MCSVFVLFLSVVLNETLKSVVPTNKLHADFDFASRQFCRLDWLCKLIHVIVLRNELLLI